MQRLTKRNIKVINHDTGQQIDFPTFGKEAGEDAYNQVSNQLTSLQSQLESSITSISEAIVTDKTLTIEDAPADAKATGDAINNLRGVVGSPLVAATAAVMTDTNKVYVYTGSETGYTNGNWYYHDGTSWVSGGVYNSVAVDLDSTLTLANKAPDSKVVGDAIGSLNEDITNLETNKQDALTFDQTPTDESANPVTSVGIKNAIEAAVDVTAPGIYETASGSIASFADGADDLPMKSAVVSIEPIQEGSGDPSPENVRPISGRTGLSVVRSGKNLLPMPIVSGSYDYTTIITVNDDKSFVITKTRATGWTSFILGQFTLKPGTYTLIESSDGDANAQLVLDKVIGNITEVLVTTRYNKRSVFTVEADTLIRARYLRSSTADNVPTKLMLFMGNTATATDYEPYKGSTYSVNWETEAGTVYGGTLDVVSGKLVVDRAKITLDGTNSVANVVEKDGFTNCRISGFTPVAKNIATPTTYPKAVCSDAKVIAVYYAWQNQDISSANLFTVNGSYIGMSIPGSFADANAIKAYLTTHNVGVCYQIATPTEIQLTPQEVRTLLGENNIWSDGGDMAVEYPADTKLYIDQKITEAIAAALT